MLAKILFVSDMHKRYKDSENVKGILTIQDPIQEEIIDYIKRNGVTHVIIGGDWYDRGFHGLCMAFGEIEMDRRLSAAVNGNVYLCTGNHFYLERDENPEMYIIQPSDDYKTVVDIPLPSKPIFKCVQQIMIGTVQIDFFHHSKTNKEYYRPIYDTTTYHIGVYHDEAVCPAFVREMEGFHSNVAQPYYDKVFNNIDYALCAHMHSKIGVTYVTLSDGRRVPLNIPGVMHATKNVEYEKHVDIDLPVITINDDSSVVFEAARFNTHVDMLRFTGTRKSARKKSEPVEVTVQKYLAGMAEQGNVRSLGTYLQTKGYTPTHLKFIEAAATGDLNFQTAINIVIATTKGENL